MYSFLKCDIDYMGRFITRQLTQYVAGKKVISLTIILNGMAQLSNFCTKLIVFMVVSCIMLTVVLNFSNYFF